MSESVRLGQFASSLHELDTMLGVKITGLMIVDSMRSSFQFLYMVGAPLFMAQTATGEVTLHPAVAVSLAAAIAIAGGLGSLMASTDKPLTTRAVVSQVLNLGTCGMALSLVLLSTIEPSGSRDFFIIGAIGVASLSGMKLIHLAQDIGANLVKRFTTPGGGQ